jgi:hypothetical protein
LHEVHYVVPYPDGPTYVTITFATPNLSHAKEMEWVFDTIVDSAEWIDHTGHSSAVTT